MKKIQVEQIPVLSWQTVWENERNGLVSPDSVSEKKESNWTNSLDNFPRQVAKKNHSFGTSCPGKETACPGNLSDLFCFFRSQLSIKTILKK